MQIPGDQVLGDTTQPFCVLKQMRYEGHVSSPGAGLFGAGAHCDWGSWTILATDTMPGLQVRPLSVTAGSGGERAAGRITAASACHVGRGSGPRAGVEPVVANLAPATCAGLPGRGAALDRRAAHAGWVPAHPAPSIQRPSTRHRHGTGTGTGTGTSTQSSMDCAARATLAYSTKPLPPQRRAPATHRPAGCFVVNSGDLIKYYTNGVWKSAMHRVVTVSEQPRFSTAFFTYPSMHVSIQPLERWVGGLGAGPGSALAGTSAVRALALRCLHAAPCLAGRSSPQLAGGPCALLAARRFVSAERPARYKPIVVSDYFHFKIEARRCRLPAAGSRLPAANAASCWLLAAGALH